MKRLIILFLTVLSIQLDANPFLIEVNKEWLKQSDVSLCSFDVCPRTEADAIQLHLKLVEKTLRGRDVTHLNKQQRQNRNKCLDILNEYWKTGVFPQNEDYDYRTPIFIDKYNTFCAVGHLMKESGFENVARVISEENNLVYVRGITNQQAADWMQWAGLSMEECAWIQPSYANPTDFKRCGQGTNGNVYAMKAINDELIVGGDFTYVDSSISCSGLAKLTKQGANYVWEDFSNGIPPNTTRFKSIAFYNGFYWAGGENMHNTLNFSKSNFYVYDGLQWNEIPSVKGNVNDIVVFKNELYACGLFRTGTNSYDNLMKYDNIQNIWVAIPEFNSWHYLIQTINDMCVIGNELWLGGQFYIQGCENIVTFDGQAINTPYLGLKNEVFAIEESYGKVYASGIINGPTHSYSVKYFNGVNWIDTLSLSLSQANQINVLKSYDSNLYYGGDFNKPGMMYSAKNLCNDYSAMGWGYLDSTVMCIEEFDGKLFIGGLFKNDATRSNLNHITYFHNTPLAINENKKFFSDFRLYPNPVSDRLKIQSDQNLLSYKIMDVSGKIIQQAKLESNEIKVSDLPVGLYLIGLYDSDGQLGYKKFFRE